MWVGYAICMLKLKFWEDLVSFSKFRPFPGSNMQKTCKKHAFWWAFLQVPKVVKNLGKMHVFCMFGPKTSKKNNKHAKKRARLNPDKKLLWRPRQELVKPPTVDSELLPTKTARYPAICQKISQKFRIKGQISQGRNQNFRKKIAEMARFGRISKNFWQGSFSLNFRNIFAGVDRFRRGRIIFAEFSQNFRRNG